MDVDEDFDEDTAELTSGLPQWKTANSNKSGESAGEGKLKNSPPHGTR